MKRWKPVALLLILTLLLTGCSGTSTGLLRHWDCGRVVSARFFTYFSQTGETPLIEELPEEQVQALAETLDSMEYKYHMGHTDYYWGRQFGIELTLEDGTYWRYDGTCLERSSVSFLDRDQEERPMRRSFVEVVGADFWKEMQSFFPATKDTPLMISW